MATDGDAGGSDRTISRPDMARLRREEQRAAAAELGVTNVGFLGYPDGRLTASIELRRDISQGGAHFPPGSLGVPVTGAQLGPHRCEPPRPPGGRRGRCLCRLP